jgi:hypothetical protein
MAGLQKELRMLFHWKHLAGIICFALITFSHFYAYEQHEDVVPYMVNLVKELGSNRVDTLYTFQETGTKSEMGLVKLKD